MPETKVKICVHTFIQDASLPAVKLTVQEGRQWLWGKTREAFRHVWNNYRDQVDWFFKADDDTYVTILVR